MATGMPILAEGPAIRGRFGVAKGLLRNLDSIFRSQEASTGRQDRAPAVSKAYPVQGWRFTANWDSSDAHHLFSITRGFEILTSIACVGAPRATDLPPRVATEALSVSRVPLRRAPSPKEIP